MEARISRAASWACLTLLLFAADHCSGASYRTTNFIVTARTPQLAREVGDLAEQLRRNLALEWLGRELPRWGDVCPISVEAAPHLGAGGATSFMFDQGRPFGWTMNIQGSRERILDSVLPHEVTHTIFATHFGGPLPRWADEGACTTVEHLSERAKQEHLLVEFLRTDRGIAFNHMFAMTEYPRDILPLYAQGHSLARYLIEQGGKRKFVDFVGRGMQSRDWDRAMQEFYGYQDLSDLQVRWVAWVGQGSPATHDATALASAESPRRDSPDVSGNRLVNVPPAPASLGTRIASSPTQDGWYARRRQAALQGMAESNTAAAGRDPFGTAAPPTGMVPQYTSRPQPMQQVEEQPLQWNSQARIPILEPVPPRQIARQPIYFDAPPAGQPRVMR